MFFEVGGFFPIGWIVLNVIFMYRLTVATGAFATPRLVNATGGLCLDRACHAENLVRCRRRRADRRCRLQVRTRLFAGGSRIRTLGPALHTHRFGPPSCRPRDGPVRQTEITRWRPGTKRSTPASAAEYTGPPPGGSPLAGYRGGVISTHRPMGTPRARWCAPARSPPWFYGRACKTMLNGVSVARLTLWKPPAPITLANPCLAGLRRAPHRPPGTARSARRPSSNPRN
jgi:hypothetical protein